MGSTKVHLNPKESHYFDRKGDSYSFLNIEPTQPGVTVEERSAPMLPASLQTDGRSCEDSLQQSVSEA